MRARGWRRGAASGTEPSGAASATERERGGVARSGGGTLLPRFVSCSLVGFFSFLFLFVVCAEVQSVALATTPAEAVASAAERSGVSARPSACEREAVMVGERQGAHSVGQKQVFLISFFFII